MFNFFIIIYCQLNLSIGVGNNGTVGNVNDIFSEFALESDCSQYKQTNRTIIDSSYLLPS